jgi:hypothetical protein
LAWCVRRLPAENDEIGSSDKPHKRKKPTDPPPGRKRIDRLLALDALRLKKSVFQVQLLMNIKESQAVI